MQASQTVPATTQQVENYLINIFCQIQKRCVLVGLSFWVTVHIHLNYCSKYFSKKIFEWSTFRIRRQPWCNIDIETDIEKYYKDANMINYIKQLPGSEDHRGVRKCSAERYTVMTRSPGKHICLFYVQVCSSETRCKPDYFCKGKFGVGCLWYAQRFVVVVVVVILVVLLSLGELPIFPEGVACR